MGEVNNLSAAEAVARIRKISDEIGTCMFCTRSANGKLESRPMSALKVDDQGNIWFLSDKNSDKNKAIGKDATVDLFYGKGQDSYMSVSGKAIISFDKQIIKDLWTPIAKVWFTEGVDDPAISAIKVTPAEGYYWDSKHGRMVQFGKMIAALATGTTMDDGIEGKLKP